MLTATVEIELDEWTRIPVALVGQGRAQDVVLILATNRKPTDLVDCKQRVVRMTLPMPTSTCIELLSRASYSVDRRGNPLISSDWVGSTLDGEQQLR